MPHGVVRPIGRQTQTSNAAEPLKFAELREQQKAGEDETERTDRRVEDSQKDGRNCKNKDS